VILPIATLLFMVKNKDRLEDEKLKSKYESIYLEINTEIKLAIYYSSVFLLRRMIFAITLVSVTNSFLQLVIVNFTSLFVLMYLVYVKPLGNKLLNLVEIVNESSFLTLSYLTFTFNENTDPLIKYTYGWVFIGITTTFLSFNLLLTIKEIFSTGI
jgi:hypothetical protein